MDESLISVIVPVYKAERYLDECVESILGQTYRNLEVILVDDGSPDRSGALCDQWAEKDPRIRVIHRENGGAAATRNTGIDVARGDYIGFVDSDDVLRCDMYEILLSALQKSEKKIACCYDIKNPEEIQREAIKKEYEIVDVEIRETLDGIFRFRVGTSLWRRLFKRAVFDNIRIPEGEVNEEYPILIPLTVAAGGMVHVRERLYYYRPAEGSVTATYWKTDDGIVLKNLKRMWEQLQTYQLDCRDSFRVFALNSLLSGAIVREKYIDQLSPASRAHLEESIRILRKHFRKAMRKDGLTKKNKIFYILVVTRTLRPVYRILGKK